jgi:lipoprotein-releasing system permease protein
VIAAFSPFVALRYLQKRKIHLLAIAGVMFAVWAMLIVDSVFTGFVSDIRRDVKNSAVDLLLTDLPHDTGYEFLRAAIESEPEVAATAPRLRHFGMLQMQRPPAPRQRLVQSEQVDFDHTQHGYALLLGIDAEREFRTSNLRQWLERGPEEIERRVGQRYWTSPLANERDPARLEQMLVPDAAEWAARGRVGAARAETAEAHRSGWAGVLFGWRRLTMALREGEAFDLICTSFGGGTNGKPATMHTDTRPVAFAGIFATGSRIFDEPTAIVPIETLRTLLGHDRSDVESIDLVTDIGIRLQPDLTPAATSAFAAKLQPKLQALLPSGSKPCTLADWEQQNPVFLSAVAHEQAMMQFVLFVVMIVAGFVIYATLHMMVTQKVKDIGILAALGGSPAQIGGVFLFGGLATAAIGTALGIGLGYLSAAYLNPINDWLYATWQVELFPRGLFDLQQIPCRLLPGWVATVAIGAMLLALLTAWLPARRAAKWNPVEALSHE